MFQTMSAQIDMYVVACPHVSDGCSDRSELGIGNLGSSWFLVIFDNRKLKENTCLEVYVNNTSS